MAARTHSEDMAVLGLAELFRAGFVETATFKQMYTYNIEQMAKYTDLWFQREIILSQEDGNPVLHLWVTIIVRTMNFAKRPAVDDVEILAWEPCLAKLGAHKESDFRRNRHPVPHWYFLKPI